MNYFETFEDLKQILEKAKIKNGEGHLAIQVCITDPDASGIFYIEDFGYRILAEPYDYYDNDAEIIGSAENIKLLFEKKSDLLDAVNSGKIAVNGNIDALYHFFERIEKAPAKRAPARKKAVQKNTSKKSDAKSTAKKKTEGTKVTEKSKNNDSKTKDTETIKEVVEKEVKPKK